MRLQKWYNNLKILSQLSSSTPICRLMSVVVSVIAVEVETEVEVVVAGVVVTTHDGGVQSERLYSPL
jgi:hypothetical protein